MRDGDFSFYTIQHQLASESPWLKPEEPLRPCNGDRLHWAFSSWDTFGQAFDPWNKEEYGKKLYQEASDDAHNVWSDTGHNGWTDLDYAKEALRRVHLLDAKGTFDVFGSYGNRHQAIRHNFRIVKVTMSKKTEVIEEEQP